MIDLHTHILPGVDDGASSLAEAVDVVRAGWEAGVEQFVATPHVREDFPTTREQIDTGLATLAEALSIAGISVALHPGAELDARWASHLDAEGLDRLTLGSQGKYVLVEVPHSVSPQVLDALTSRLLQEGFFPVLAHPERSAAFAEEPRRLVPFLDAGCLVQVNAGSFVGDDGRATARTARQLLELEMVHVVASDTHGPSIPRSGLDAALAVLGPSRAQRLTRENPAAILAGDQIERPSARAARRRWLSVGRR